MIKSIGSCFTLKLVVVLLVVQGMLAAAASQNTRSILFIGNSFTYGGGSPVQSYRANTVTDLNGDGVGGVPSLFKSFADQAGFECEVSLETSGGKNLDYHARDKADVIGKSWDYVVLQGYSTLDRDNPGDPERFSQYAEELADLLKHKNPEASIWLVATWSRADQTYLESGHWFGKPIEQMALDVRAGCDLATKAAAPAIKGVIPVGEAWNRAMKKDVADSNPYDGITAGQIDLWTGDHYHASAYGYYLQALVIFGEITGLDPRTLGKEEHSAVELGFSPEQALDLQQIAYEQLSAGED